MRTLISGLIYEGIAGMSDRQSSDARYFGKVTLDNGAVYTMMLDNPTGAVDELKAYTHRELGDRPIQRLQIFELVMDFKP